MNGGQDEPRNAAVLQCTCSVLDRLGRWQRHKAMLGHAGPGWAMLMLGHTGTWPQLGSWLSGSAAQRPSGRSGNRGSNQANLASVQ